MPEPRKLLDVLHHRQTLAEQGGGPERVAQQHKKGKTATQIRAGIIKGEWKQIDLNSAATIN